MRLLVSWCGLYLWGNTLQTRTFQAITPLQALIVEQALLLAQQLEQTADTAPAGHVLARVEAFAVPAGREFTRQAVQAALQAQAEAVEKRGALAVAAPTVRSSPGTKDSSPVTS